VIVRELVFSFPLTAPERPCAGRWHRAVSGESTNNAAISDGREYTPQHFILEAFREFLPNKICLIYVQVSTTKWNYCAGPA
jgi:hypothetical protein